jgi:hypothetical protein
MKNTAPLRASQPESRSRLLVSEVPDAPEGATVHAVCESCHWTVLATRRFRGRTLCVACVEEHFAGDEDIDE